MGGYKTRAVTFWLQGYKNFCNRGDMDPRTPIKKEKKKEKSYPLRGKQRRERVFKHNPGFWGFLGGHFALTIRANGFGLPLRYGQVGTGLAMVKSTGGRLARGL